MLVFLVNLIWSMLVKREPAEDNPWNSKSAEWQLPTPVPVHDFDQFPVFDADPYPYGVEPPCRRWRPRAGGVTMEGSASAPTHPHIELEPPEWQPRAMWVGARHLCGAAAFFFVSFVFAYFYLRSLDPNKDWKIGHVNPSLGRLGLDHRVVLVVSAAALRVAATRPSSRSAPAPPRWCWRCWRSCCR